MRFFWFILLSICFGCSRPTLLNETIPVKDGDWDFGSTAVFETEIQDSLNAYNFSIHLRHGGGYNYQNLILFFKTYYPNNTYEVDTVDCPLASKDGRWLGSGLGDIIDNQILFKINQQFPISGVYKFEIQHAMRADTIHEIYDVGLLISKASE